MKQFNRQYKIFLGKDKSRPTVDGTVEDPAQVVFTVENIFGGGVSYAEINIYNLNSENRDLLTTRENREKAGLKDIELWAGYEGNLSVVFSGVIRNAFQNTPDGINWVVTLYCRGSGVEYEDRNIEHQFGKNTPYDDVINTVAQGFGLPVKIYGSFDGGYIMGLSVSGDVKSNLNELGYTHGFKWQIENKKVVIIKDGEVRSQAAQSYDKSNLLIGGTELTEVGANIAVKLNPSLIPHTYVDIKSVAPRASYSGVYEREVSVKQGRYRIFQVTHTGDFEGDTWETRVQCLR